VTPDVWSKADLHIHSDHSDGLARIPDIMEYVQHKTDLKVIAITDHNTMEGALFAKSLQDLYDFEVIVGEEISSKSGHVIGLFLQQSISRGSAGETIARISEQDGIAIVPLPSRTGNLPDRSDVVRSPVPSTARVPRTRVYQLDSYLT
jgi:predicted metal-dependent phosphoesterase TrpH